MHLLTNSPNRASGRLFSREGDPISENSSINFYSIHLHVVTLDSILFTMNKINSPSDKRSLTPESLSSGSK